jgi:hypothetical protein
MTNNADSMNLQHERQIEAAGYRNSSVYPLERPGNLLPTALLGRHADEDNYVDNGRESYGKGPYKQRLSRMANHRDLDLRIEAIP